MTTNRPGRGNVPTELMAEYYAQRASAGLITAEASQIASQGVGYPSTPGIHSAEQVAGWRCWAYRHVARRSAGEARRRNECDFVIRL